MSISFYFAKVQDGNSLHTRFMVYDTECHRTASIAYDVENVCMPYDWGPASEHFRQWFEYYSSGGLCAPVEPPEQIFTDAPNWEATLDLFDSVEAPVAPEGVNAVHGFSRENAVLWVDNYATFMFTHDVNCQSGANTSGPESGGPEDFTGQGSSTMPPEDQDEADTEGQISDTTEVPPTDSSTTGQSPATVGEWNLGERIAGWVGGRVVAVGLGIERWFESLTSEDQDPGMSILCNKLAWAVSNESEGQISNETAYRQCMESTQAQSYSHVLDANDPLDQWLAQQLGVKLVTMAEQDVLNAIQESQSEIMGSIASVGGQVVGESAAIQDVVRGEVRGVKNEVQSSIDTAVGTIKSSVAQGFASLNAAMNAVKSQLTLWVGHTAGLLSEQIEGIDQFLKDYMSGLTGEIEALKDTLWSGFVDAILDAVRAVAVEVWEVFAEAAGGK